MPKKTVFNVLKNAGKISENLYSLYKEVRFLKEIPRDIILILTEEQKVQIVNTRYELCKKFQSELIAFWKVNFDKEIWRMIKFRLDCSDKTEKTEFPYDLAYKALCRADMNVSHDINRTMYTTEEFLKQYKKKENKPNSIVYALLNISTTPSTLLTAYELYTGQTDIDIRHFFPDVDFSESTRILSGMIMERHVQKLITLLAIIPILMVLEDSAEPIIRF